MQFFRLYFTGLNICKCTYGLNPFIYWLHGRDFFEERRKWVEENKIPDVKDWEIV